MFYCLAYDLTVCKKATTTRTTKNYDESICNQTTKTTAADVLLYSLPFDRLQESNDDNKNKKSKSDANPSVYKQNTTAKISDISPWHFYAFES